MIQPKLSVFDIAMIVVSLVIGVGIFRTPAIVAQSAGSAEVFFAAWIAGGFVSLCGALTYAEIGARYHFPGGFYKLISTAFHPVFAFMLNWVIVLTYGAGLAGVALIGAEYINPLLPVSLHNKTGIQATVVTTVLFFFVINYLGIRSSSRLQNVLSSLKIILMAVLCLGAVITPKAEIAAETLHSSSLGDPIITLNSFSAFAVSLIAVFYTYGGYQQTLNFGADIKNPIRNTPRGILIGMGIVIGLYLCINYAYYRQLGFSGLANSRLIAADLARALFGNWGFTFVSVAIFVSVLGYINATLLSLPRVFYAMADDGVLPPIFKKVNERTQVQEFTLIFITVVVLASLLVLGTFEKIVNYVMSIDSLALASAAASIFVFRHRVKGNDPHTGYRIRFYPWIPLIFVLFLLAVSVNVILSDPVPAAIGWGLFFSGAPLYWVLKKVF
jgi:APA family basic amino acid/polyamine antiporter